MQDPFGFPIAFYYQSIRHKWLLQDYHLHSSTGIQRVDHCNMLTPDVDGMMRWYMEQLNFRLSEYSADEHNEIWAAWIQRRGSVHDLAMTNGRGPRMHHFAYWVPESSRIFQICDVLGGAREFTAIERGPGVLGGGPGEIITDGQHCLRVGARGNGQRGQYTEVFHLS